MATLIYTLSMCTKPMMRDYILVLYVSYTSMIVVVVVVVVLLGHTTQLEVRWGWEMRNRLAIGEMMVPCVYECVVESALTVKKHNKTTHNCWRRKCVWWDSKWGGCVVGGSEGFAHIIPKNKMKSISSMLLQPFLRITCRFYDTKCNSTTIFFSRTTVCQK